jgi:hypothetical protein
MNIASPLYDRLKNENFRINNGPVCMLFSPNSGADVACTQVLFVNDVFGPHLSDRQHVRLKAAHKSK